MSAGLAGTATINLLINNAGVRNVRDRRTTADGCSWFDGLLDIVVLRFLGVPATGRPAPMTDGVVAGHHLLAAAARTSAPVCRPGSAGGAVLEKSVERRRCLPLLCC
ncbi:hypothetical protein GCM10022222_05140 [Amycolatopsis ultiminotia]|uniref:Uncharacterized protein n=1 Tax=Amycolatopsis ultiminotia TaxID=543629 RepID=A0ABP6V1F5_9PSEU